MGESRVRVKSRVAISCFLPVMASTARQSVVPLSLRGATGDVAISLPFTCHCERGAAIRPLYYLSLPLSLWFERGHGQSTVILAQAGIRWETWGGRFIALFFSLPMPRQQSLFISPSLAYNSVKMLSAAPARHVKTFNINQKTII